MRTMEINLGGKDIELSLSFGAANEIAKRVADPLLIWRESQQEHQFLKMGITGYDPKFKFDLQSVCAIIHIGMKHVDKAIELSSVQEMVFDGGLLNSQTAATEYLVELLGAGPEEVVETEKGDAPKK